MGIFTRLFKGGQDGGDPPDGDDPPELPNSEAPDTEPVEKVSGKVDKVDAGQATNPFAMEPLRETPRSLPAVFAGAGSAPTATATVTPDSMWAWPGSTPKPSEPVDATSAREPLKSAPRSPPPPRTARPVAEANNGSEVGKPEAAKPATTPTRAPIRSVVTPAKPVVESKAKPRDPTKVMSPPPAPAPSAPPAPAKPTTAPAPARPKSDSINTAFDGIISSSGGAKAGVSTAADLAEVRRVFEDVAAVHVSQVRDVMLELRYGNGDPWIDATRPALESLRAMASQLEFVELCSALDEFCASVEAAVANRDATGDDRKAELLRRYQRLVELIPQAFELDAERDRREPIIVEALLSQVEGVEKPTIEKLFGVGLGRLDALLAANAEDLAAVSGLRPELASAIVALFRAYRASATATLAAPDAMTERKQLYDLLLMLSIQNDDFNRAAGGWTDADKAKKREARKGREQTFQRIKVALARLGEREQLAKLEKMPFDQRIATLDKYLSTPVPAPRV